MTEEGSFGNQDSTWSMIYLLLKLKFTSESDNGTQWAQNANFRKFHDILQRERKLIFCLHGLKDIATWM